MDIAVLSDLHIDTFIKHREYLLEKLPKAEACFMAGDLCELGTEHGVRVASAFLKKLAKIYPHIYYVSGNHDCWGASIEDTRKNMAIISKEIPEFHYIDYTTEYKIGDYKIVGDTLWFKENEEEIRYLSKYWIDHRRIYAEYGDFEKESDKFMQYVVPRIDEKTIVMSHHMPHISCVADEWIGSDCNVFFLNDMEPSILSKNPKLWICGHTHNPVDTLVGKTRIYCNPAGYDYEGRNPEFLSRVIVQI